MFSDGSTAIGVGLAVGCGIALISLAVITFICVRQQRASVVDATPSRQRDDDDASDRRGRELVVVKIQVSPRPSPRNAPLELMPMEANEFFISRTPEQRGFREEDIPGPSAVGAAGNPLMLFGDGRPTSGVQHRTPSPHATPAPNQ